MAANDKRQGQTGTRRSGSGAGARSRAADGGRRSRSTAATDAKRPAPTTSATDVELAEATASEREGSARREAARTAPRSGGDGGPSGGATETPSAGEDAPDRSEASGGDQARGEQSSEQKRPGGLAGVIQRRAREGSLDAMDVDFARAQRFLWDFVQDHYFRMETEGWHRLPDPATLIVGIHAAGIFPVEAWMFGLQWNRRFGDKRILHGTAHDALMATPLVGQYFRKMGVMSASRETVTEALAAGRDVLVYPGGDIDSLRPWTERDEVKLAGRRGFVKQAIKSGVPIVPLAKTGGTDTMFTLPGGRTVARALGLKQLARMESLPLAVGLPWGIAPGVLPFLPLPAKLRIEILDPLYLDDDPARADDDEYVDMIYEEVEFRIEEGVGHLKRKRSFPILG
jgi:1-acyl-sn-glycerol-3-phosphate acyltransferase